MAPFAALLWWLYVHTIFEVHCRDLLYRNAILLMFVNSFYLSKIVEFVPDSSFKDSSIIFTFFFVKWSISPKKWMHMYLWMVLSSKPINTTLLVNLWFFHWNAFWVAVIIIIVWSKYIKRWIELKPQNSFRTYPYFQTRTFQLKPQ